MFAPSGRRHIDTVDQCRRDIIDRPGIRYVIDAGFARISRYSARSKIQRLPVERISQASAEQRKGRLLRVAEGICIRLYDGMISRPAAPSTEPEIQRTNLAAVILQMTTLGFGDIDIPFVDPPVRAWSGDGYKLLEELAAVDNRHRMVTGSATVWRLPVDPGLVACRLRRPRLAVCVRSWCPRRCRCRTRANARRTGARRPMRRTRCSLTSAQFQHS